MGAGGSAGAGLRRYVGGRIMAGIAVCVPAVVTFLTLRLLFRTLAGILDPVVRQVGSMPEWAIAATSIAVLLVVLFAAGVVARVVIGRRLIALGESIVAYIPLVGSVYGASKQVIGLLSGSDHRQFRGVVWVEFPRPGFHSLGFVTGATRSVSGEEYLRLFIPTAPNPTSGFLEMVRRTQVADAGISVEDALKLIVSGGVLAPPDLVFADSEHAGRAGGPSAPEAGGSAATDGAGSPDEAEDRRESTDG